MSSGLTHLDRLAARVALAGLDVVDIGAGEGATAAAMAGRGARVTGVEIDGARVARAQAAQGGAVAMVEGRAEALTLPDASADLVTLFFALHHVPVDRHDAALAEILRVLRPGGRLYVVEPLPEGTMFDLVRLVDDETTVRQAAQARLVAMDQRDPRFGLDAREAYTTERRVPDLDRFIERIVMVDPARAARLPDIRPALAERFAAAPRDETGAAILTQPCVACLFRV